jgi:hypothetical protein
MRRGNWVLKIFGGQKDAEDHPELTPSQAMYLHWVQYCVNNMAKNKFLPRFRKTHGRYWHYRKLDGRLLIVTIQETLLRGSRSIDLARFCDLLQKERELVLGIIKGGIDPADPTSMPQDLDNWSGRVAKLVNSVREQFTEADFQLWVDTVLHLQDVVSENYWHWDLHSDNIMFRGPTPVIMDPWHSWHESWEAVQAADEKQWED